MQYYDEKAQQFLADRYIKALARIVNTKAHMVISAKTAVPHSVLRISSILNLR